MSDLESLTDIVDKGIDIQGDIIQRVIILENEVKELKKKVKELEGE